MHTKKFQSETIKNYWNCHNAFATANSWYYPIPVTPLAIKLHTRKLYKLLVHLPCHHPQHFSISLSKSLPPTWVNSNTAITKCFFNTWQRMHPTGSANKEHWCLKKFPQILLFASITTFCCRSWMLQTTSDFFSATTGETTSPQYVGSQFYERCILHCRIVWSGTVQKVGWTKQLVQ